MEVYVGVHFGYLQVNARNLYFRVICACVVVISQCILRIFSGCYGCLHVIKSVCFGFCRRSNAFLLGLKLTC